MTCIWHGSRIKRIKEQKALDPKKDLKWDLE